MDDARVPSTDQLMAEMAWVRRLARALVKDAAVADDIAQDTWIVAAEQQPDVDRPLRPWLGRVVTNLVRNRRTGDARRERRHGAVGDDRAVPTPAELLERVELQRAVADEVVALGEPYRSTLLLHFFEGFSSADIARRLGIPDGTVRRRLKVALDQLRDALRKRSDQPTGGWLAALLPFARLPAPTSAAVGVLTMKKVIGVVVVLVLLVMMGAGALWRHRAHSGPASTAGVGGRADRQHAAGAGDGASQTTAIPDWIVQPGVPARHIAGHVMHGGKPVAGAKVLLGFEVFGEPTPVLVAMPGADPKILQPIAQVTSGADGAFDFGVQPAAMFTVSASASSYTPMAVVADNANPRTRADQLVVDLRDCRARLFGTIADASGGGIANARISDAGLSGAESDAAGRYSLCLSPRDVLGTPSAVVRVEADGYGTMTETVMVSADLHHDFLLVPEAVLVGRVTTRDGAPVAGARVIAGMEPAEIPHHLASRWTDSDAEGRFRIAGLAPGAFQLNASAKGMTRTSIPVVAQATKTSREIRVVLERRGELARVSGHVFAKELPVGGILVQAMQNGRPAGSAQSQADGSFELIVPYGPTRFLAAPAQPGSSKEIQIASPRVEDVRVDVAGAATVHGHVTRHGKPVAGADILYIPAPQATMFGPPPAAKADESGAFTLLLPFGAGQLFAWDNPGKAFADSQPVDITSTDDRTIDIELAFSGEVQGTVVDQAGTAVAGVYVRLDHTSGDGDMCESLTDGKGQFDCNMLTGGDYRATVTPSPGARQGFAPASGDFETIHAPGDGAVTGVQLAIKDERVVIRGSVVDDAGAALADAHIEAMSPGGSIMDFPSTLSDAGGHFEIGNLARGTYTLVAHAADGSEGQLPGVVAGSAAVTVTVARAGAIEGTLTGFTSTPDIFVISEGPPDQRPGGGRAIVDGATFSRSGLRPGRYRVDAVAGAQADAQSVDVKPGETARVDLRTRDTGTVEGVVAELATHGPVDRMRCDAQLSIDGQVSIAPPDPSHQAFTDPSGHFVVSAPVGRTRIMCFPPNGGPWSAAGGDVDVASGAHAQLSAFSVRATFAGAPADAGFVIVPGTLPLTVGPVAPGGPGAAAGLRTGDQVLTIDGKALEGVLPDGATILIANHRHGTTVTLGISRGGSLQTIKVAI